MRRDSARQGEAGDEAWLSRNTAGKAVSTGDNLPVLMMAGTIKLGENTL